MRDDPERRSSNGGRFQHPPPARKVRSAGCPPAEGRAPRPPWNEGHAINDLGEASMHSLPLEILTVRLAFLRAVVALRELALPGPAIPKS